MRARACAVGNLFVFGRTEQDGNVFAVLVKDWESHAVEITVGEVLVEYEYEPQQMGLW